MALFETGRSKTGGRAKGARNKLSVAFLDALAKDFVEFGEGVIKIVRIEHPDKYLAAVAGLMPKEFEFTENKLMEIPDDELDSLLEYARRRILERTDDREGKTTH
jgi:hypothetical protein